jgi:DNA-binding CsgD family transcriptional regulator
MAEIKLKQRNTKMNEDDFKPKLDELTPRQKRVLKSFLLGKTDDEIQTLIQVTCQSTVRHHISNICHRFNLSNKADGGRFVTRVELIELFIQFKSDWVCANYHQKYGCLQNKPVRPGGAMVLNSPFYLQPTCESRCCEEVLEPGALVRILAPHKMGKTSLLNRVLAMAQDKGCYSITCNLRHDIDSSDLANPAAFFQQFFKTIAQRFLPGSDAGPIEIGGFPTKKSECTSYFQHHILSRIDVPLVLAIDEADRLFEYPAIAGEFFELLRCWFDYGKTPGFEEIWDRLRLVIVHSTDNYIHLNQNKSPFGNVGLSVRILPLQADRIQDLAKRYPLNGFNIPEVHRLMEMVGGHPFLIQQAFYSLWQQETTLDDLLKSAPTLSGIYRSHLQELLNQLKSTAGNASQSNLLDGLKQVIESEGKVQLTQEQTFILEGMGLVQLQGNQVHLSCEMYRRFFKDWL